MADTASKAFSWRPVFYHGYVSVEACAGLKGLTAVAARQPCPCAPRLRLNGPAALSHFGEAVQQVKLGLGGGGHILR